MASSVAANPLSPSSISSPSTFAEAAMSTTFRAPPGPGAEIEEVEKSPVNNKQILGKLAGKKAKKWRSISWNEICGSEKTSSTIAPSRSVSGDSRDFLDEASQRKHDSGQDLISEDSAIVRKPSGLQYSFTQDQLDDSSEAAISDVDSNILDFFNEAPLDQEAANDMSLLMADLQRYNNSPGNTMVDPFDSIEWDSSLASVFSIDKSPEQVVVTELNPLAPKVEKSKLAYTTVGSIVNTDVVPQVPPPNRIQREGANRHPIVSARQYEMMLQAHGPPPPTYNSDPAGYSDQWSASYYEPARNIRPRSAPQSLALHMTSEQEKQALGKLKEMVDVQSKSRGVFLSKALLERPDTQLTRAVEKLEDVQRTFGAAGVKQGLEKMQTLQRLARFENPMREHALNRLSEFSVVAKEVRGFETTDTSSSDRERSVGSREQEPPAWLQSFSLAQSNPLLSGSTYNSETKTGSRGYPAPIEAGPPGKRSVNPYLRQGVSSGIGPARYPPRGQLSGHSQDNFGPVSSIESLSDRAPFPQFLDQVSNTPSGLASPNEPFGPSFPTTIPPQSTNHPASIPPQRDFIPSTGLQSYPQLLDKRLLVQPTEPRNHGPWTALNDTLPLEEMIKYYPHGLPYISSYTPLSPKVQAEMDAVCTSTNLSEKGRERENQQLKDIFGGMISSKMLNDFFYYGHRRYDMTDEQHILDLEARSRGTPFGPVGPPRNTTITSGIEPDVIERMSATEAVEPAIYGLFGTMLAYAEIGDKSRKKMSGWVTPEAKYVDRSIEGNRSCFGEDWGRAVPFDRVR